MSTEHYAIPAAVPNPEHVALMESARARMNDVLGIPQGAPPDDEPSELDVELQFGSSIPVEMARAVEGPRAADEYSRLLDLMRLCGGRGTKRYSRDGERLVVSGEDLKRFLAAQASHPPVPVRAPQDGEDAAETLKLVCDVFGIGSAARSRSTILANVENAFRRSNCLWAVEHEFFMTSEPDEDDPDGEPFETCLLNWGDDPDKYIERFGAALDSRPGTGALPATEWLPMDTAPTDGTMVRLLVDYSGEDARHPLEDADPATPRQTIGANNDSNVDPEEGEGWLFAGWSWEQDCFTQGHGKPIGWLPLAATPPSAAPAEPSNAALNVMELALEALDDDSPYGRLQAQRLLRNGLAGAMPCPACKGQGGGEGWIANENDRSGQSDYRAWVACDQCNPNIPPPGGEVQVDAAREPDMFWDSEDGETFGHSIEDVIDGLSEGEEILLDCAMRLPQIKVRAKAGGDYEILPAAIAANKAGVSGGA